MPCEKLRGINNSITFDLSEVDDFTVVTKTWIINELIYQKHYYFLPEMAVYDVYSKSKKAINNMLPLWVEQGYVELCPGETISYTQVCDKIIGLIDPQTKIIGYDSYHAKDIVDTLNNRYKRLPLVSLKQSSL
jgi:phage terminase large subunit-like protein